MSEPTAIDAAVKAATAVIPVDPDDGTCIVAAIARGSVAGKRWQPDHLKIRRA